MKSPILGGFYKLQSPNAAYNRLVNLYPEQILEGGFEAAYLTRCPGLLTQATLPTYPIQGFYVAQNYLYVVAGDVFYRIGPTFSDIYPIGNVQTCGNPVIMTDNGIQIFLACNPNGYIFNMENLAFGPISSEAFNGAQSVGYVDGYFVYNEPNSQRLWSTQILDGGSIDPSDFSSAEASSDNIQTLGFVNGQIWVFGEQSTQVFVNTPVETGLPFAPIQGAFNEIGCGAMYSVAKLNNALIWFGQDRQGSAVIYRTEGYLAKRVSNHAVEREFNSYRVTNDAIAYGYQQDGHWFYVITFPTESKTWVYDATVEEWHERAGLNSYGEFIRHPSNNHVFWNNLNLVGSYNSGKIYSFDTSVYSDDGAIQKCLRTWRALPTKANNLKRTIHDSLQIECQVGVGTNLGQGSNPLMMLRYSDDGGHTWSNEVTASLGLEGETYTRVLFRRLGATMKSRDRVYEISVTDPVALNIMGAELTVRRTNA